ncbi:MAG: glycoside hydrolase family 76 protein [Dysgonomonas sp.]|nr:glycoside hydrolase family 76 protein [Dysgonomonas sp.]
MEYKFILPIVAIFSCLLGCSGEDKANNNIHLRRAQETLDSLYKYYSTDNSNLLRETYPFDTTHIATYLATNTDETTINPYSYLWPYSGTFSAVNALLEASTDEKYLQIMEDKVLSGLEEYFDVRREPYAYASYINSAPLSDRFYDDNIWLGIDFTDLYRMSQDDKYLEKARLIAEFIESGTDDKLDGGIYWCEQKKESKNTCSNAPGAVLALKLFEATSDSAFFYRGKVLYNWTKTHLRDSTDNLYFDNISLDGKIDKTKYAYNSGQMIQAASLLYKLTGEDDYLADAQKTAESSFRYFFENHQTDEGNEILLLKKGDIWFTAVMFRGSVELYNSDNNPKYIKAFEANLDYAWNHMREGNGLFNTDWSGSSRDSKKWLLTQAAMIEMYARMADISSKL